MKIFKLGAKLRSDGKTEFLTIKNDRPKALGALPPESVSALIAAILAENGKALPSQEREGELATSLVAAPTGYSIHLQPQTNMPLLVFHYGKASLAIPLAEPKKLAEALLALSAGTGSKN